MLAFASLTRRGQLQRLRRLGRTALASYGVYDGQLTLLRHQQNTTFKVEARGGPFVLRINRPRVHTRETIGSEMAWLSALRRDTALGVPAPVAALDGSLAVVATDPSVPEEHVCVLLRRLDGRFVDQRLTPAHLHQVGLLQAHLQKHAESWAPPSRFLRPRVDTLTEAAKVDSMARCADSARAVHYPTSEDGDRARQLVEALVSSDDAGLLDAALELVRATTRKLAAGSGSFGLIHDDLHYENVLFHRGAAQAIDFDDCGWGFHLYDLAVTLWELEGSATVRRAARRTPRGLCTGTPAGGRSHGSPPGDVCPPQDAELLWILESREHTAFREGWRAWAREELDGLAAALKTPTLR